MALSNLAVKEENLTEQGIFILSSLSANTLYRDGKATGETDGFKALVVTLPSFDKVIVKIPGKVLPDGITNEAIQEQNAIGNFVYVRFANFVGKLWQDFKTKEVKVSAAADNMQILDDAIDLFEEKE